MTTTTQSRKRRAHERARPQRPIRSGRAPRRPSGARRFTPLLLGLVVVAALLAVFVASRGGGSAGGDYPFAVGDPGPGQPAPPIRLAATDGTTFDLASHGGERVLLYFQEGLMCQPCWDQLRDIERDSYKFDGLGIDRIVSITTDPVDLLRQKVADEGLRTAILSDPDVSVSRTYSTNQYGMMGDSMNGHSFIVVQDGTIVWRADYGGAPNYTMYLPVDRLVADLAKGLGLEEGA